MQRVLSPDLKETTANLQLPNLMAAFGECAVT